MNLPPMEKMMEQQRRQVLISTLVAQLALGELSPAKRNFLRHLLMEWEQEVLG